jgi:hypothetical protein
MTWLMNICVLLVLSAGSWELAACQDTAGVQADTSELQADTSTETGATTFDTTGYAPQRDGTNHRYRIHSIGQLSNCNKVEC